MEIHTSPLGRKVIGCAIEVHATIGPGVLESMYQRCLAHEFTLAGLRFQEQVPLPLIYKGVDVGIAYRVDFIVEGELLLELKTVDKLSPVHDAQVLSYLHLLRLRQGILMNFHVKRLIDGLRSLLNARLRPSDLSEELKP